MVAGIDKDRVVLTRTIELEIRSILKLNKRVCILGRQRGICAVDRFSARREKELYLALGAAQFRGSESGWLGVSFQPTSGSR